MGIGTLPPPYPVSASQPKPQSNLLHNFPPSPREIEKWKGLKPVQKDILRKIARSKGSSAFRVVSKRDLAKELGVSKPTVDRQVEALVKVNLLVRKTDGKIKDGPARKNAYKVIRQIYKEENYTDAKGKKKVRVTQPGLEFNKALYVGKQNGKPTYVNPPNEEHSEPFVTTPK